MSTKKRRSLIQQPRDADGGLPARSQFPVDSDLDGDWDDFDGEDDEDDEVLEPTLRRIVVQESSYSSSSDGLMPVDAGVMDEVTGDFPTSDLFSGPISEEAHRKRDAATARVGAMFLEQNAQAAEDAAPGEVSTEPGELQPEDVPTVVDRVPEETPARPVVRTPAPAPLRSVPQRQWGLAVLLVGALIVAGLLGLAVLAMVFSGSTTPPTTEAYTLSDVQPPISGPPEGADDTPELPLDDAEALPDDTEGDVEEAAPVAPQPQPRPAPAPAPASAPEPADDGIWTGAGSDAPAPSEPAEPTEAPAPAKKRGLFGRKGR